jgi:predicted nucleic acid-binding protein
MRNGPTAFFVDTNVLVYAYDPEEGDKRSQAMRVLARFGTTRRGSISAHVLGEFFVAVTRKITPPLSVEEAAQRITNYVWTWGIAEKWALKCLSVPSAIPKETPIPTNGPWLTGLELQKIRMLLVNEHITIYL